MASTYVTDLGQKLYDSMREVISEPAQHPVPLTLAALSGTLGAVWIIKSWRGRNKRLPPSPKGTFLFGNLLEISEEMHLDFLRMQKRDNLPDIMTLNLGPSYKMIILNSYDAIKDTFLTDGETFAARAKSPLWNSTGVVDEIAAKPYTDPDWKEGKAFLVSALRAAGFNTVNSIEDKVAAQMGVLLEYLAPYIKDKKPVKLKNVTSQVAANIINQVLYNKTAPLNDPALLELLKNSNKFYKLIMSAFVMEFFPIWLGKLLFRSQIKQIRKVVNDLIQPFRDAIEQHRETLDHDNLRDFLDIYLSKKQGPIDDELLANTMFIFYPDAVETTGGLLEWILLRVATQTKLQDRIQQELDDVVGDGRAVAWSDRSQLPYTMAVISEVMRTCCMAVITGAHSVTKDTYYKGHFIPKGVPIYANLYAALNDPKYFDQPEEFRPERFLGEDGKFRNIEGLIPFGVGRRMCMGESLVRMETFLLVVSLIQRYSLRIPEGVDPPALIPMKNKDRFPEAFPLLVEPRK